MAWFGHLHFPSKYSIVFGVGAVFYLLVYIPITSSEDDDSRRGIRGTLSFSEEYRLASAKGKGVTITVIDNDSL